MPLETPSQSVSKPTVSAPGPSNNGTSGKLCWPLSVHLVILAAAVLAPLVLFFSLNLGGQIEGGRSNLRQSVQQAADSVTANIEREMRGNIAFLSMLSQDSAIDRGDYSALYQRAKEGLESRPGDVSFITLDLKPVFTTRLPYGADLPVLSAGGLRQQVQNSAKPAVSDVYTGQITRRLLVAVAVPVVRKGQMVGFLQLSVEPADLVKAASPAGLLPRWTYAVADSKGAYLMASDARRARTGQALDPVIADQIKSESGGLSADSAGGETLLTAYRKSPMLGWTAFASVPTSLAEYSFTQGWRNFIYGALGSLAIGTLASLLFSRAMTQPIQRLTSTALAFGNGESGAWPAIYTRVRETRDLGAALSDAARNLQNRAAVLARSEKRFRLIAEQAPDVVWVLDTTTGRFDYLSPAFEKLSERPADTVASLADWRQSVHPDDLAIFDAGMVGDFVDGSFRMEYRIARRDGGVRWVRDVRFILEGAEGEPPTIAGIIRDVTTRRNAVDALKTAQAEAEARLEELENLYASAPIGLALVDTNLSFVRLNDCLVDLSAFPDRASVGLPFFAAFPDLERKAKPLCEEILRTGSALRDKEIEIDPSEGRPTYLLAHFYPIRRENGIASGIGIILENVTERRRAEQAAKQLAAIVEAANHAIFSFAPDGRIQNWNPAAEALFQYSREEAISKPFSELFPDGSDSNYLKLLAVWRSEGTLRLETVMARKDGSHVPVSISMAPIKNGSTPSAVAVTIEDITERKHWEDRRQLMNRELSHRVKNALAIVQAMSHHTLRSSPTPAAFTAALEGRLRAMSISHNLLTLSEWEGADMRELIGEQLAPHMSSGAQVNLSGPALLLPPGTVTSLGLILHEMASNAEKYGALSKPEGVVTIEWSVTPTAPNMLVLQWAEAGGPQIRKPEREGFGSVLIASSGRVDKRFETDGLKCTIELPFAQDRDGGSF